VSIPVPSGANVPLTAEQVKDLTMMCDPSQWPVENLLAMKNYHRNEEGKDYEPGTLIYSGMVHRFMFWPGLSFHMNKDTIQKILKEGNTRGPLLAFQLEDLVREGWEVD
jgi:hypothetical protein